VRGLSRRTVALSGDIPRQGVAFLLCHHLAEKSYTRKKVHFRRASRGRKVMKQGERPKRKPLGSVPRISRLMALALRLERLVKDGQVTDYADLARLAHVTRARITQIMNLLLLAPDIQEAILFLPCTNGSRALIAERHLRPIAAVPDWRKQRRMWEELLYDQRGETTPFR